MNFILDLDWMAYMTLPLELQKIIDIKLELLRTHTLKPFLHSDRFDIYQTFGKSNYPTNYLIASDWIKHFENGGLDLSKGDYVLSWLAILTAKKVLPIWENSFSSVEKSDSQSWYSFASEMITSGENTLLNKTNVYTVFRKVVHDEYYLAMGNVHYDVNKKALWACYAAYYALRTVFLGTPGIDYNGKCKYLTETDPIVPRCHDFARIAAKAYCTIGPHLTLKDRLKENEAHNEVSVEPQKRLEFWEWWLTQAIPQAWELAQQSR